MPGQPPQGYRASEASVEAELAAGVPAISTEQLFSGDIELSAATDEAGVFIVFFDGPDGDKLAKINAHGTGVGSGENELAIYTTKADGSLDNRMKFWAERDDTPLILTGSTGVARSSGLNIVIGASVDGGGTSTTIFDDNILLRNNKSIDFEDSSGITRTFAILNNSDDLFIRNESAFADSPIIKIQNRDSEDNLQSRIEFQAGDTPDIDIKNANLDLNDNLIKNVSNNNTADSMTSNPETDSEDGYIEVDIDGSTKQIPFYNS